MLEWKCPHQSSKGKNRKTNKIGKPLTKLIKKKKKRNVSETRNNRTTATDEILKGSKCYTFI